jgi:hypothetical protein
MTDARVGRLRLTAPDEALVRRGAFLVEDAMRIATLAPDADRRAYFVRHLDVGVIDPDAPPQTLALQIERRLAHVQRTAVPATSSDAATARAVWFADETTAIAELARRLAHGTPTEWFWRHVAGGAVTAPSPAAALQACLVAAARQPAGPLAIAAVVDAAESEREGAMLGLLAPADGDAVFRATFGPVSPAGLPSAFPDLVARLQPRWHARLVRWLPRWGADTRSLWLAALAVMTSRGSLASVDIELARARQVVAELLSAGDVMRADPQRARPRNHADEPAPAERQRARDSAGADTNATQRIGANEAATPSTAEPLDTEVTLTSAAAGALFLLRPLAHLGIAEWLADHPWTSSVNWPAQLLASIVADYAGAEDPLALALSDEPLRDGPFVAPPRWRALVGQRPHRLRPTPQGRVLEAFGWLPLAAWDAGTPDLAMWREHPIRRGPPTPARPWAARAWQRALGRWLRMFSELSLEELVRRRATVTSTRTHIDLVMPLRSADVRIRTAGLDIDPGWVPWLGRIIRFHYREEPR